MQADFERTLSNLIRARRLLEGILALVFLALFVILWITLESTKAVAAAYSIPPLPSQTIAQDSKTYLPLLVLSAVGAVYCGIMLTVDLAMCGHRTIRKDSHYITICRGIGRKTVYVDGRERGRISPFSSTNVVEFSMPNQVLVSVRFSHVRWYMAVVSCSDDIASREV